jgi:chromosome segregation ATPase
MEQILLELKQRLEILIAARTELELRCNSYSKEIQDMRIDHESSLKQLQTQLSSQQDELHRLREHNNILKSTIAGLESATKTLELELQDTRRRLAIIFEMFFRLPLTLPSIAYHCRLAQAEEQVSTWRKELQVVTVEKNALSIDVDKFRQQLQHMKESRAREFAVVRDNVLEKVRAEFDSMRIDLKVPAYMSTNDFH